MRLAILFIVAEQLYKIYVEFPVVEGGESWAIAFWKRFAEMIVHHHEFPLIQDYQTLIMSNQVT